MAGRRPLGAAALLGAAVAVAALWRRRSAGRADKVDLYFEDGSMLSFGAGSDEAERLLPLARRVISAGRGT